MYAVLVSLVALVVMLSLPSARAWHGIEGCNPIDTGDGDDFVVGTSDCDHIETHGGGDKASGRAGRDALRMGAGHDKGLGGQGDDFVRGGDGNDNLAGNDDNDYVSDELDGTDADDACGGTQRDSVWVNDGDPNDRAYGQGPENVSSIVDDDSVIGEQGDTVIRDGNCPFDDGAI